MFVWLNEWVNRWNCIFKWILKLTCFNSNLCIYVNLPLLPFFLLVYQAHLLYFTQSHCYFLYHLSLSISSSICSCFFFCVFQHSDLSLLFDVLFTLYYLSTCSKCVVILALFLFILLHNCSKNLSFPLYWTNIKLIVLRDRSTSRSRAGAI